MVKLKLSSPRTHLLASVIYEPFETISILPKFNGPAFTLLKISLASLSCLSMLTQLDLNLARMQNVGYYCS